MADTKNYGLKGIGDDVQFGKAGGRFVFNTGASDFRATTDGTTLAHLQVLEPVGNTDAATKLYVDNVAAGLDPKESCQAATTGDILGVYATSPSNGQITGVAATIDGVTLAQGDRVLVKDQSIATQNGIYEVQATTTTLTRASDMDGSPAAEVSAGNFTFIEAGTTNADTGWVLQGDGILTLNTDNLDWVQFSGAGSITAGVGLSQSGTTIDLDFVTGGGMTNTVATVGGDFVAFSDTSVSDTMQLRTWTNVLADLDIVNGGGNGILTRTAADTYTGRTITASAVSGDEGISVVNGNGVSGNPTIGIDIQGTTALAAPVATGDSVLMFDTSAGVNLETTVDQLKTFMNAGTSSTSITEGNSTLSIADAGAGVLTTNIDGTDVISTVLATTTFQNGNDILLNTGSTLTITDLTNNRVLLAGTAGLVEDSANLTFDGTTLAVTGAATVSTDLTVTQSAYLIEQAAAGADTATQGQLWTRDDAPNTSMFTDDAGNDFVTNNIHETDYNYSSAITSTDPGPGSLNFNSVTIGSITTLYIDDLDGVGKDYAWALDNLAVGDILTIRSASNPANYIIASVSTTPTDNTGFWTIPLTLIYTGTIFTNGDQLRITIEWQSQGVSATPTLITVADSSDATSFPAFFESATGDLGPKTDASNYTYNATSGALTAGSYIGSNLTDNRVLLAGVSGLIEDDANFTFNGTTMGITAAVDITGDLDVDNININLNTISNTSTDADIIILPNGTGSIIFQNGSAEEILELNDAAAAVNGLAITPGATGTPALIAAGTGSDANIDIGFIGSGTGVLTVTGTTTYETQVTDDDDIPNKKYVDDAISAGAVSGALDTVTGTVDLTTASTQNIGAAAGIPASCTIMSVLLEIDTASDAVTTVTVGDATNGAASYMAATENDPEVLDIYIANGRVLNAAVARQATATVAVNGTVGSATCIITFRHA